MEVRQERKVKMQNFFESGSLRCRSTHQSSLRSKTRTFIQHRLWVRVFCLMFNHSFKISSLCTAMDFFSMKWTKLINWFVHSINIIVSSMFSWILRNDDENGEILKYFGDFLYLQKLCPTQVKTRLFFCCAFF